MRSFLLNLTAASASKESAQIQPRELGSLEKRSTGVNPNQSKASVCHKDIFLPGVYYYRSNSVVTNRCDNR